MEEQRRWNPKEQRYVGFARHAGSMVSWQEPKSEHLDVKGSKSLATKVETSIHPGSQQRRMLDKNERFRAKKTAICCKTYSTPHMHEFEASALRDLVQTLVIESQ